MATFLGESEIGPNGSCTNKYLVFGEKTVKISPVNPEKIVLCAIIKKGGKLTQAKYIDSPFGNFAEQAKWKINKISWHFGNFQRQIFKI